MLLILTSIWIIHVAALLVPGANTLVISQLALTGNTRGAIFAAIGIAAGAALWALAAALGIKAVFEMFPSLRLTLQAAGGIYLLYVAYRLWKAGAAGKSASKQPASTRAFQLGLLTNLSNPKAALFFGSIFSASLPATPNASLLVAAIVLIAINSLFWHVALVYLFSRRLLQAAYESKSKTAGRVASVVVGAFGFRLLIATLREAKDWART